jgi:hypothetical protein
MYEAQKNNPEANTENQNQAGAENKSEDNVVEGEVEEKQN